MYGWVSKRLTTMTLKSEMNSESGKQNTLFLLKRFVREDIQHCVW